MNDSKNVIATLNDLLETCRDGEEGFRLAAEHVEDEHLRTLFTSYCEQRSQLARELRKEISKLGGTADDTGSVSAALHRGWMNLKEAITGHDDAAILAECERGEDVAIDQYRKALECDLPADVRRVVNRQHAAVAAAHDRIRELEKAHEKVS